MPKDEMLGHCKNLEVILTDEDSFDINGLDLADELSVLVPFYIKSVLSGRSKIYHRIQF